MYFLQADALSIVRNRQPIKQECDSPIALMYYVQVRQGYIGAWAKS